MPAIETVPPPPTYIPPAKGMVGRDHRVYTTDQKGLTNSYELLRSKENTMAEDEQGIVLNQISARKGATHTEQTDTLNRTIHQVIVILNHILIYNNLPSGD